MIPDCHPTKARGPPGLLTAIRTAIHRQPFTDHYTVIPGSELGRGKFAVVRKCVEKCSGLQFAAKFMRKRRKGQDCRTEIIHEIAVLELATPCPLVVDLHQVYESTSEMVLVLEWSEEIESSMEARYCAAGGEIFNRCVSEDEAFSEDDVKRLMRQILEGVSFLHQHNVVHLDLKPQNILLTSSSPLGDIRIVDFGLSRVVSNNQELREIMGTPEYVAPEILNYEPISTATDMWSVGVLAYVMLTGVSPFLGEDKQETFLNICQIDDSFSDEEVLLQEEALSFIQTLLRKHQPERASAQQCLQHSWLRTSQLQKQLQEQLHPAEVLESPKTIIEPPKCISTPEEEEEEEEEKGLVREELMVMAAYTLDCALVCAMLPSTFWFGSEEPRYPDMHVLMVGEKPGYPE